VISRCKYPGCEKTLKHPRVFFAPPEGWGYVDFDDEAPHKTGLYCPQHTKEIEAEICAALKKG
jgi:hypothetical protein